VFKVLVRRSRRRTDLLPHGLGHRDRPFHLCRHRPSPGYRSHATESRQSFNFRSTQCLCRS
jgi:hypothetical protein